MKRLCICMLGLLAVVIGAYSQDNHNYVTPSGKSLFYREVQDANRMVLGMNEIQPLSKGMDGLVVHFSFRADLSKVAEPVKLLSFTEDTEEDSYLDVFYQNGTVMLRRKFAPGSEYYYDYDLYDPMFSTAYSDYVTWDIRLFFTGYFFWIETHDTHAYINNRWHAPIFFGINLPTRDFMKDFLARSASAKLIFGEADSPVVFNMPDEVAVYEFKYTSLKDELQANFCND